MSTSRTSLEPEELASIARGSSHVASSSTSSTPVDSLKKGRHLDKPSQIARDEGLHDCRLGALRDIPACSAWARLFGDCIPGTLKRRSPTRQTTRCTGTRDRGSTRSRPAAPAIWQVMQSRRKMCGGETTSRWGTRSNVTSMITPSERILRPPHVSRKRGHSYRREVECPYFRLQPSLPTVRSENHAERRDVNLQIRPVRKRLLPPRRGCGARQLPRRPHGSNEATHHPSQSR